MAARFQVNWLNSPEFKSWIQEVPGDVHKARCLKCHKTFSLSNMGARALRSHAKGVEHQRRCKDGAESVNIASLFSNKKNETLNEVTSVIPNASSTNSEHSKVIPESPTAISEASTSYDLVKVASTPNNNTMKTFLVNDMVMKAEIRWCLQTVMCHKSMRSASADVVLMKTMFPNCEIVQKMQLQRTKIAYSILYGIAPYFIDNLLSKLTALKCYAIGFDESLNKVSQRTQMDINIRFWDVDKSEVCTKYFTSVFLNGSTSDDLRKAFKDALLPSLNIKHVLQISMDGPNVNHKFLRDIKEENQSEDEPVIINIGTCGLHTMNCAFKTAIKETGWSIVEFLRALYNLFKDVPARRGKYTEVSGSKVFPRKFCSVRWLENRGVAERAIEILPDVIKYINSVDKAKRPSSSSFKIVAAKMLDPLLTAKLAFFISLTSEVEGFLKEYQTDDPMVPFLHTAITVVIKSVMSRFVKPDILSANALPRVDLNDAKNILPVAEIDLGYGTRRMLRKQNLNKKLPDSCVLQFRKDCCKSLRILTTKLLEKSPVAYPMVKALTVFDPSIASNEDLRKIRIRKLLTILEDHRHISSSVADQAEKQFHVICSEPAIEEELKGYSRHKQRVDHFWSALFKKCPNAKSINLVLEIVMLFFHGNSNVERGFSINKECMIENMKEETLVAQRIVYDSVKNYGSGGIEITKSLVHSYKNSRSRLTEETKKREREEQLNKDREAKKRKLDLEKRQLEAKIAAVKVNATKEVEALTEKINDLNNVNL